MRAFAGRLLTPSKGEVRWWRAMLSSLVQVSKRLVARDRTSRRQVPMSLLAQLAGRRAGGAVEAGVVEGARMAASPWLEMLVSNQARQRVSWKVVEGMGLPLVPLGTLTQLA